jgi:hypothetical protein
MPFIGTIPFRGMHGTAKPGLDGFGVRMKPAGRPFH